MMEDSRERDEAVCREVLAQEPSGIAQIRIVRERLGLDLVGAKALIERVRTGRDLADVQEEYIRSIVELLDDE